LSQPAHRRIFLLVLMTVLILSACRKRLDPEAPYVLIPIGSQGRLLPEHSPVRIVKEGITLEVTALTAPQRSAWLRRRLEIDQDPLVRRGLSDRFLTFRLVLRATGKLPVHIESQSIRLWPGLKEGGISPLDYTRVYELLRPDKESAANAKEVENFMRGIYDGPIYIDPGQGREGLLLIKKPSAYAEHFLLKLSFVQVGSKTLQVSFPFSRQLLGRDDHVGK